MAEQVLPSLREVARVGRFALGIADLSAIRLVDKNARYMTPEVYQTLVANIKRDGQLSSAPFVYVDWDSGTMTVISGNHRIKAARDAGLTEVPVMYNVGPMSDDEVVALQLSHNALVGQDDLQVLRELWESIDDVELRVSTGLSDDDFAELERLTVDVIAGAPLPERHVTIAFVEQDAEQVRTMLREVQAWRPEWIGVAGQSDWETFLAGLDWVRETYQVFALDVVMMVLARVLKEVSNGQSAASAADVAVDGMLGVRFGAYAGVGQEEDVRTLASFVRKHGLKALADLVRDDDVGKSTVG